MNQNHDVDLRELHTRVSVTNLLTTYQFLADSGKTRQLSELFTDDAIFDSNGTEHTGPSGVFGFCESTKSAFLAADFMPARHYLSTIHVRPQEDGSAKTYACFQYVGTRGLDHWGTYRDLVVEVDGTWKFARRVATVEGCVPDSPVVELLGLDRPTS